VHGKMDNRMISKMEYMKRRQELGSDFGDSDEPQDCVLSDESDGSVSGSESEPELVILDDSDEYETIGDKIRAVVEPSQFLVDLEKPLDNSVSLLTGAEEFQRLITDDIVEDASMHLKNENGDNSFDFDDFCQDMLFGESHESDLPECTSGVPLETMKLVQSKFQRIGRLHSPIFKQTRSFNLFLIYLSSRWHLRWEASTI